MTNTPKSAETPSAPPLVPGKPYALAFDPDAYRAHLRDAGLTRAEEDEYLSALWKIIVVFVDLGFDIHPQGLDRESLEFIGAPMLGSGNTSNHINDADVARSQEQAAGRKDS